MLEKRLHQNKKFCQLGEWFRLEIIFAAIRQIYYIQCYKIFKSYTTVYSFHIFIWEGSSIEKFGTRSYIRPELEKMYTHYNKHNNHSIYEIPISEKAKLKLLQGAS